MKTSQSHSEYADYAYVVRAIIPFDSSIVTAVKELCKQFDGYFYTDLEKDFNLFFPVLFLEEAPTVVKSIYSFSATPAVEISLGKDKAGQPILFDKKTRLVYASSESQKEE